MMIHSQQTGSFLFAENEFRRLGDQNVNHTLSNLAFTDALLRLSGEQKRPILHLWHSNRPTVILGMMDAKLTRFEEATAFLMQQGYEVCVRSSGGLGIVSDETVLNFSFLLYNSAKHRIPIDAGYEWAFSLLQRALLEEGLETQIQEVKDSYCPGSFDIVSNGKKIAGLAQRRVKDGLGIMGYLSVSGDQRARSGLMRDFYRIGKQTESDTERFPEVSLDSMSTVSSLLSRTVHTNTIQRRILHQMEKAFSTANPERPDSLEGYYSESFQSLLARNHRVLENSFKEEVFI